MQVIYQDPSSGGPIGAYHITFSGADLGMILPAIGSGPPDCWNGEKRGILYSQLELASVFSRKKDGAPPRIGPRDRN